MLFCSSKTRRVVTLGSEVLRQTPPFKDISQVSHRCFSFKMQPGSVSPCSRGLSLGVLCLTVRKLLSIFRAPFRLVVLGMLLSLCCLPELIHTHFSKSVSSLVLCRLYLIFLYSGQLSHKMTLKEVTIHLDGDTSHSWERSCCRVQSGKTLSKFRRSSLQFSFNQHHVVQDRMLVKIHQEVQVCPDPRYLSGCISSRPGRSDSQDFLDLALRQKGREGDREALGRVSYIQNTTSCS